MRFFPSGPFHDRRIPLYALQQHSTLAISTGICLYKGLKQKPLGLLPWHDPLQVGPTEGQPHVARFGSSPTVSTEQQRYTSGFPKHKGDATRSNLWLSIKGPWMIRSQPESKGVKTVMVSFNMWRNPSVEALPQRWRQLCVWPCCLPGRSQHQPGPQKKREGNIQSVPSDGRNTGAETQPDTPRMAKCARFQRMRNFVELRKGAIPSAFSRCL